ncbi:DUF5677 domain-containing protein [Polaribacter dokdonensis]|uniref:Uncharacterized protein n=1 Tax=Polaribacter dokdonensis DSW-5 TaxID=1300348 RepID=A0A0M9CHS3_9FLAO|nr:DUF5677 domain-containing protein [Polaribacter dokdonensis]KOY52409.1 hypothetical protein I602_1969 [Polaribacter dokdonensis DSW-5]SEE44970.1 hypothetical protein SAMN05444353_1739 [Polaribacter dokdonensis DSW-5]
MEIEELRRQCKHFFWCDTIPICQELLDVYANFFFEAVVNHNYDKVDSQADADARMVLQMMMTKVLHLKNVLNGVDFTSKKGKTLNNIIDPTIVASLIRNIYETTGMFNLIYHEPKTKDEKQIKYLLWVHAGLSYRNRFDGVITLQENKDKMEDELKQMESIRKEIEQNPLFRSMDEKNQGKIRTMIKKKDYLIKFNGNQVSFLSWRELVKVMDIKGDKLDQIYTYFSLYAHPSNVAVFQFKDMFGKNESAYKNMVIFNLQTAFMMLSIFIADYIKAFPKVLKTYEKMGLVEQIVINFHNRLARGGNYDINESWKATEEI